MRRAVILYKNADKSDRNPGRKQVEIYFTRNAAGLYLD
jgi:hypothetical protein